MNARTYTAEELMGILELNTAYGKMAEVANLAASAEIGALSARGYLADVVDKDTRDKLRELADAALNITLEADRIQAALGAIRREVQA